nr:methyltransferase domain-containing protein [Halobellus rufus]
MTTPTEDAIDGVETDDAAEEWDSDAYDGSHAFVYEYGESVVDLLDPTPGERILDLGCGTGHLTERIADAGAEVVGIDQSDEMIETARETYPDLEFRRADARDFDVEEPVDAVFSNAALHWIDEQDAVTEAVADALAPGGRYVAELGGSGNVARIVEAVAAELTERGYEPAAEPWYFPTVGEHATTLEAHGFEVRYARLFDRPTELDDGEEGMAAWIGCSATACSLTSPRTDVRTSSPASRTDCARNYTTTRPASGPPITGGSGSSQYARERCLASFPIPASLGTSPRARRAPRGAPSCAAR